jgi:LysM repeat protein
MTTPEDEGGRAGPDVPREASPTVGQDLNPLGSEARDAAEAVTFQQPPGTDSGGEPAIEPAAAQAGPGDEPAGQAPESAAYADEPSAEADAPIAQSDEPPADADAPTAQPDEPPADADAPTTQLYGPDQSPPQVADEWDASPASDLNADNADPRGGGIDETRPALDRQAWVERFKPFDGGHTPRLPPDSTPSDTTNPAAFSRAKDHGAPSGAAPAGPEVDAPVPFAAAGSSRAGTRSTAGSPTLGGSSSTDWPPRDEGVHRLRLQTESDRHRRLASMPPAERRDMPRIFPAYDESAGLAAFEARLRALEEAEEAASREASGTTDGGASWTPSHRPPLDAIDLTSADRVRPSPDEPWVPPAPAPASEGPSGTSLLERLRSTDPRNLRRPDVTPAAASDTTVDEITPDHLPSRAPTEATGAGTSRTEAGAPDAMGARQSILDAERPTTPADQAGPGIPTPRAGLGGLFGRVRSTLVRAPRPEEERRSPAGDDDDATGPPLIEGTTTRFDGAPIDVVGTVLAICPYLQTDEGWRSVVPSRDHRCAGTEPRQVLSDEKQRRLCLTARHEDCGIYLAAVGARPTVAPASSGGTLLGGAEARRSFPGGAVGASQYPASRWGFTRTSAVVLDPARRSLGLGRLTGRIGAPQLILASVLVIALIAIGIARLGGQQRAVDVGLVPTSSPVAVSSAPAVQASPEASVPPTASPTPAATATPRATVVPTASHVAGGTYTVRTGDTLFAIANRNGTTVKILQQLNGLGTSTVIHVGQVLKLP